MTTSQQEVYETIRLEKKDKVATLTFDRMEKKNAANRTMLDEIIKALISLKDDKDIRVVVLTGQDNVFCAGMDVAGLDFRSTARGIDWMKADVETFKQVETIPKVVIGAVNGLAFGFGAGIILSCDIVYASDQAKFGLREIHWGLVPADMIRRGMELMGKRDIAYLSITGDDVDAHEAKAMGWINKVIPHDQLMDEVYTLADRLGEGPPVAYDVIKRMLNRKCHEDFDSYIETVAALFATEDAAEAREAFLEKRKPVFKGR